MVNSTKHLQSRFRRNIRRLSELYPEVLPGDGDSIANLEKIPQAQAGCDRADPRSASMRYKFEGSHTKMKAFLQDVDVADPKDKEIINPQEKADELAREYEKCSLKDPIDAPDAPNCLEDFFGQRSETQVDRISGEELNKKRREIRDTRRLKLTDEGQHLE